MALEDDSRPEALELLLRANTQSSDPLPQSLVVEVFRLGEQHANDSRSDGAVAGITSAIERAAPAS